MQTKLIQLQNRIDELENVAWEVQTLADQFIQGGAVQPRLSQQGERWYRGCRELMVQQNFSGLGDFDDCYSGRGQSISQIIHLDKFEPEPMLTKEHTIKWFKYNLQQARALVNSVTEEIKSRELPIESALSLTLSADEFDKAQGLYEVSKGDEPLLRAAGVVTRVALERHLFTIAETRKIKILLNPPSKKRAEAEDVITTLYKAGAITPIQQSELQTLFKIANNCAHPKEAIKTGDVERLIKRARELASAIT